jgi:hypothetical protein
MGTYKRPGIIVIKCGWNPCRLIVTEYTTCREPGCHVIRVCCCIIVTYMASLTSVWGIVVVSIMASRAIVGDGCVCSEQRIIVVVNRECSRYPVWTGGVAGFAGCRQVECQVTWVGTLVIV